MVNMIDNLLQFGYCFNMVLLSYITVANKIVDNRVNLVLSLEVSLKIF